MATQDISEYLTELNIDEKDINGSPEPSNEKEHADVFLGHTINSDRSGDSLETLADAEKDDIITELVRALKVELGDFTLFQIRNIILYYTGRTGNLANYSEPPLLLIGLAAVLREIQLCYKEYHASESDRFPAKVGAVVGVSKLLTVISFCVADYFYLRDDPSVTPDKVAGIFFIALFAIEALADAMRSAHYPGNDYRAVTFFTMFFLKVGLFAAATMQFFEKTELPGLIMAAVLFPLVFVNLQLFSLHYQKSKTVGSSIPSELSGRNELSVVDEESQLLPTAVAPVSVVGSVNADGNPQTVVLSENKHTFLQGIGKRIAGIPAHLSVIGDGKSLAEMSSPPRPPM